MNLGWSLPTTPSQEEKGEIARRKTEPASLHQTLASTSAADIQAIDTMTMRIVWLEYFSVRPYMNKAMAVARINLIAFFVIEKCSYIFKCLSCCTSHRRVLLLF
ncbi:unnamed protein product [Linum trigynum]|uniref:Uncharacterized protein n=1 Tax=Linum trigynum TaxID=586398 RepID=A0AAV2DGX4_9ROSI